MLSRITHHVAALAATSLAATVVMAGPASAADLEYRTNVKKVVVNQNYEVIKWRIGGALQDSADYADVNLEHVATRELADYDYSDAAPPSGALRFYDFYRYGRYKVYGEVYDYDFDEMVATPTYVIIKAASRSPLTVNRSGAYVTLRTTTKKYTGGYPLWAPHRKATIRFQRLKGDAWETIAKRTVPSDGTSSFRYRRPRAATYRVVVAETGKVWGFRSGNVRR